jgi:hypothetical protein
MLEAQPRRRGARVSRRSRAEAARLLAKLCADPSARLIASRDGFELETPSARKAWPTSGKLLKELAASGLLEETEPGRFAASSAVKAWLERGTDPDFGFRVQHDELRQAALADGTIVLKNLQESPIALLARASGGRQPWLAAHAVAAAERLRGDFEKGQLQPRVTANWSASVATGRRAGDGGGLHDLTDMAVAARLRFNRAMHAVGPELSGVLVDVCCFLKGLETVERERQWPARSAKLVLRLGLDSLARHYGLAAAAAGEAAGRLRHWGAEGYRPEIT